ncbi:MAG: hypothetical protein SWE60_17515 [Thermodesulfobacteriota bacterium]|nr:hypothetical protein [Thermodesulfobacteriota bacterium]
MDKARLETRNHFFKVHGISTESCHEPKENCRQKAIRAHSIPCATVIDRLAREGHVVMPQLRLKTPPPAEIQFKRVGVKKASTFTGLCAQHDNDIFRIIDDDLPDLTNNAHLFLLAYRAALREYHVVLQNALRFQTTYQKRVEVGLSPGTEPCRFGMFATSHLCNAFESYEYKRHFDLAYLANDWSQLKHYVVILRNQSPTIAVSSMFSLDDFDAPETPRVTLSVYPTETDVAVVFSATLNDAPFVDEYLHRLLISKSYYQKYLLSKLVLQSCDNLVIDPQYYDSMSQEQKEAIEQFNIDTVNSNIEDHEDERLFLF